MGIVDRLGDLLKSYFFDGAETRGGVHPYHDPDLDDAWAELNDFMDSKSSAWTGKRQTHDWEDPYRSSAGGAQGFRPESGSREGPPETLRADFAELGVAFGANEETCKTAYKKLLKTHHPDRHAGHEGDMKKATAKSAKINAAYENIRKWRATL
jgi:DnaJ-domain-containing protein 1